LEKEKEEAAEEEKEVEEVEELGYRDELRLKYDKINATAKAYSQPQRPATLSIRS
jgi:hypothetical protein